MDMASFLKISANLLMTAVLVKWLARDLSAELRKDTGELRARSSARVHASPCGTAVAAAAVGIAGGVLLARRSRA